MASFEPADDVYRVVPNHVLRIRYSFAGTVFRVRCPIFCEVYAPAQLPKSFLFTPEDSFQNFSLLDTRPPVLSSLRNFIFRRF